MAHNVHVIDHPLVQHKLTLLRRKETSTTSFRRLLNEIGSLMAYEVTRDVSMHEVVIETPLETMHSKLIDGKKLVFVPILRAGTGLLDGFLSVVPGARVGHVGLYRDPKSLVAVEYYFKMPGGMKERDAIVLDPMLATGNSAVAAVERLKETSSRVWAMPATVSSAPSDRYRRWRIFSSVTRRCPTAARAATCSSPRVVSSTSQREFPPLRRRFWTLTDACCRLRSSMPISTWTRRFPTACRA